MGHGVMRLNNKPLNNVQPEKVLYQIMLNVMVTWPEFTAAAPDLVLIGRRLLLLNAPRPDPVAGLAYLATLRPDGGPRLHPISPAFVAGRLYAFVLNVSPKQADLRRDGRYALHSWPHAITPESFNDEEFYFTGRAFPVTAADIRQAVAAACGDAAETGQIFELQLERVLHKSRSQGSVIYRKWRATPR